MNSPNQNTHEASSHAERSILTRPPVSLERLFDGQPILEPVAHHFWESRVVLNAGAALIDTSEELEVLFKAWNLGPDDQTKLRDAGGACVLLYRAQGEIDPSTQMAPSYLGMAVFTPGLQLVYRHTEPILSPKEPFHNLGIEDPRCTKIGETYYLHYTGHYFYPPAELPVIGRTKICLATTVDFIHWDIHGPVPGDINDLPNKNAALFPEQVHEKWILMHRPMDGKDAMAIHLASSDAPEGPWSSTGVMMSSYTYKEFKTSWIGAAGPPIALGSGRFLMIYHQGHRAADGTREYDLAAALIDFNKTTIVQSRIEPIMRPTHPNEQVGDPDLGVDNVIFSCANFVWDDRLIIPYAGADSRICGASIMKAELVSALEN